MWRHVQGVPQDLEEELRDLFKLPDEESALRRCLGEALESYRGGIYGEKEGGVRSPILFGLITSRILDHPTLSRAAKLRACETVFDVIPLPEREDEAFFTAENVPPGLQGAAHFLLEQGEFTEYHLLHLIYALFLDPVRATQASSAVLEQNLTSIISGDLEAGPKLLFAYLLLASPALPPRTATELLSRLLDSPDLPLDSKRFLCLSALDSTFSAGWFVQLASKEGLYSLEEGAREEILREARVRPLPHSLSPKAQKWLLEADTAPEKASKGEEG